MAESFFLSTKGRSMTKLLSRFLALGLLFALSDAALASSVTAPGKVFYVKDGAIVQREASLVVPSRGEGKVILKTQSMELEAAQFSSRQENGRTIFYVLFRNIPMAPAGTEMAFKGTYVRGSNLAVYYGDIFKRAAGHSDPHSGWDYSGGFRFGVSTEK
jgi:hypothetical protein